VLLAAAAVPAASLAAYAHDALVTSDPAAGATVTSLAQVTLTFNADPIDGDGADVVQVVGPDGRYYETDCPSLAGPVVTAPVALGPAGEYRVEWKIVSSDGHPVSDVYTFTFAPTAGAVAAKGEASPVCGREAPPTDAAAPPSATGGENDGLWLGFGIAVVVLAGVGLGVWLLVRRPRAED
jgi:methionine-rich copper-binding protein CopC